jgi:hypothetical protein
MNDNGTDFNVILLLVPIVLVQLGLMAFALYDLVKRTRVKGGNKWVWGIIIVVINIIGPILYFVLGREED